MLHLSPGKLHLSHGNLTARPQNVVKPGSGGVRTARNPGFTTLSASTPRRRAASATPAPGAPQNATARATPGAARRRGLALLGLPEDLVDLRDLAQQLVRLGHVHAALGARGPGQLGGLVEQLV